MLLKRVLITGANRGIGLELTRQLLARGDRVFATCRQPDAAADLRTLKSAHPELLSVIALDVADTVSIDASFEAIHAQTSALDWLFNNAGVGPSSKGMGDPGHYNTLGQLDADSILNLWRTNAIGPLMVAQRYLDLLKAGDDPRILNISSGMGSLTNRASGGSYAYTSSKAALNMLTRSLAFDVLRHGIVAVTVNPGWVQTDMGGRHAPLPVRDSAYGLIDLADDLTREDAGRFLTWDGNEVAW
jgi:NAD(P)-dependent dehydrogenase (short-subunit alcohol dehydrogenase family)